MSQTEWDYMFLIWNHGPMYKFIRHVRIQSIREELWIYVLYQNTVVL